MSPWNAMRHLSSFSTDTSYHLSVLSVEDSFLRRTLVIFRTSSFEMTQTSIPPGISGRPTDRSARTLLFPCRHPFPLDKKGPPILPFVAPTLLNPGPRGAPCDQRCPVIRPRPCLRFNPGGRKIGRARGPPEAALAAGSGTLRQSSPPRSHPR